MMWESAGHSQRDVAGPPYSPIAPHLEALVGEHLLVAAEFLSDCCGTPRGAASRRNETGGVT
jgi:hypothetical protein